MHHCRMFEVLWCAVLSLALSPARAAVTQNILINEIAAPTDCQDLLRPKNNSNGFNHFGSETSAMAMLTVLKPDPAGDGLPFLWETAIGPSDDDLDDAALDPEPDSMTNREEFRAGTDPRNDRSSWQVSRIVLAPGAWAVRMDFYAVGNPGFCVLCRDTVSLGTCISSAEVPSLLNDRIFGVANAKPGDAHFRDYRLTILGISP